MLLLISSLCFIASSQSVPMNGSLLTSTYAKVAKWGATSDHSEGRSSGQSLYTQRSEAEIRSGQNLPYQYGTSRVGNGKIEKIPGKGEVTIQERFNPRPYFDYGVGDSKPAQDSKPAIVYSSPAGSYQPSNFKPSDIKPSYDSPVSSYVPVASGPPKNIDAKPADDPYNSPISSYNPAPSGIPDKPESSYQPSYNSDSYDDSGDDKEKDKFPGYVYNPPDDDKYSGGDDKEKDKFPGYVYNPPDDDKYSGPYAPPDDTHEKPDSDDSDSDDGYMDHPPKFDHHDVDLTPPVPDSIPKNIPQFIGHNPPGHYSYDVPYSFDDHHHHVYHEIKTTTTTTEAPEDERVNKGHYSYYYLGRKLWYVPLYFSVYFIIYITVLILKSIARHKVNFAHDWKAKGRSFEGNELDETTADVHEKMESFKRRYIAM